MWKDIYQNNLTEIFTGSHTSVFVLEYAEKSDEVTIDYKIMRQRSREAAGCNFAK